MSPIHAPRWLPLRPVLSVLVASLAVASSAADARVDVTEEHATRRVQAHTTFLADDLLEGRATGERGFALAAAYVVAQFQRLGLAPAGDDAGYLQRVPLLESRPRLEASRLGQSSAAGETAFEPGNDFFAAPAPGETAAEVTAEAVFVGYGVEAPAQGYDDFAGVDLRGKIAVLLPGAPATFPSEVRAHHASLVEKYSSLVRRGAVGVVTVITPFEESRYPWGMTLNAQRFPAMRRLDPAGAPVDAFPELRVRATVRRTSAGRLFAAAGRRAEEVFAAADRSEPQSGPLGTTLTLAAAADVRTLACTNVLGWLPGSDPALAAEPLVFTAHLDHVGIGAPVNGDAIYNGAMDNAIGIAALLEVAEQLAAGAPPRRPVLFAALTAEEKGLLGAYHLAAHPPQRVTRFAANLNVDMPTFPAATRDVIAWGAEHSTLGPLTEAVARTRGFTVSPDPWPEETIFVRSDQYPFVRAGVPALYLGTGIKPLDPAVDLAGLTDRLFRERYHKPSDDLGQPIDWPSAGAFAALAAELARAIADDATPPAWRDGSFFGGLFGPRRR